MTAQALKAVATRTVESPKESLLEQLLQRPMTLDVFHAMDERDNALIRDEVTHGATSKAFVYEFEVGGKKVTGVSVIGARELAAQYKGIKSRIVATVEKRGSLFIFRTFTPLSIETRVLHELEGDDDFYECVMEVSDIKTGNSIEVRKKETRSERKRNGDTFDRPHFDVIAESKAFRNGVLSLLPQSVVMDFKKRALAVGNSTSEQTIDQLRDRAAAHAVKHSMALDRKVLGELSFAELQGLGAAAGQGLDVFKRSAAALGLVAEAAGGATPTPPPPPAPAAKRGKGGAASTAGANGAEDTGTPPAKKTYAQYVDMVQKAGDADSAAVFLDQARTSGDLDEQLQGELAQVFKNKWETQ
jgi:hypothetical protein